MDKASEWIVNNLNYIEERSGIYTLFHLNKYTGISIARSHEEYNHFAQWYLKINGKIKKSFEIREKEKALREGYVSFYEMVGENILKMKEAG